MSKKQYKPGELAYDYDLQEWITGDDAKAVRRQQLSEELELLRSARGQAYAEFSGFDLGVAIAACERELSVIIGGAK